MIEGEFYHQLMQGRLAGFRQGTEKVLWSKKVKSLLYFFPMHIIPCTLSTNRKQKELKMYNGYQYFNLYCKVICICDGEYPHLYNYFKVSSTRKQQKSEKYLLFCNHACSHNNIHIHSLFTLYEGYVIFLLISIFFTWALRLGCIRIIFQ